MKKYLALSAALFAVVVLMASSAVAQTTTPASTAPTASAPATAAAPAAKKGKASGGGAAGKADKDLADLTKTLTLTDDQQAKIKPILADESAKIRAGKKGSTASADDTKAANKAIRDAANQQIRALLTPDQQKIFDASNKKGAGSKSTPAAAPTT